MKDTRRRSQWFPPEQEPWEPGLYEREYSYAADIALPDRWDGERWWVREHDKAEVEAWLSLPWRGLAEKPNEAAPFIPPHVREFDRALQAVVLRSADEVPWSDAMTQDRSRDDALDDDGEGGRCKVCGCLIRYGERCPPCGNEALGLASAPPAGMQEGSDRWIARTTVQMPAVQGKYPPLPDALMLAIIQFGRGEPSCKPLVQEIHEFVQQRLDLDRAQRPYRLPDGISDEQAGDAGLSESKVLSFFCALGLKQSGYYEVTPGQALDLAALARASNPAPAQAAAGAGAEPTTDPGSSVDEQAAVEFYRLNPSAALFDLRRRINGPIVDRAAESREARDALKRRLADAIHAVPAEHRQSADILIAAVQAAVDARPAEGGEAREAAARLINECGLHGDGSRFTKDIETVAEFVLNHSVALQGEGR